VYHRDSCNLVGGFAVQIGPRPRREPGFNQLAGVRCQPTVSPPWLTAPKASPTHLAVAGTSPPGQRKFTTKDNRWTFFNNGSIRGVQHSQLVVVKSRPGQTLAVDSVGVFRISRGLALAAALVLATVLAMLLSACGTVSGQKGGQASTSIVRPGRTNLATVAQPENPKQTPPASGPPKPPAFSR
jgi:hypothetical protein